MECAAWKHPADAIERVFEARETIADLERKLAVAKSCITTLGATAKKQKEDLDAIAADECVAPMIDRIMEDTANEVAAAEAIAVAAQHKLADNERYQEIQYTQVRMALKGLAGSNLDHIRDWYENHDEVDADNDGVHCNIWCPGLGGPHNITQIDINTYLDMVRTTLIEATDEVWDEGIFDWGGFQHCGNPQCKFRHIFVRLLNP